MSITPVVPLRPWLEHAYNVTTLELEGREYDFAWERNPVLRGPTEVGWEPEVDTSAVFSHEKRRAISWEEFQEETLWLFDTARLSAYIYSRETQREDYL